MTTTTHKILCGHCHKYHDSIQAVRDCSGVFATQVMTCAGMEPPAPTPKPDVPAGRYALKVDDTWKFYKVDKPTEGRWAGYTFVSIFASDEKHPVRSRQAREGILSQIAVDPQRAMLDYGQQIGSCGHCGRTLTNPESIERGIGPICAERMGW